MPVDKRLCKFPYCTVQNLETGSAVNSVAASPAKSKRHSIPLKIVIALLLAAVAAGLGFGWDSYLDEWEDFLFLQDGSWWVAFSQVSLWLAVAALLWRVWLAVTYTRHPVASDEELPFLSVVVPAYNEGKQVLSSLNSLCASDYPAEKLEIIAVDDGSRDDTWLWIRSAAKTHAGRIRAYKLPVNRGKRHALFKGFGKAKGEILATVDSDSEVAPDALRRLVSPMVFDERVGAMAGNVRVLNLSQGVIPKMLDVAYTFSFDFIRAGQSRLNTVMTSPGALSAYRCKVVAPHLDAWLNQRFLGREAKIGEDRALTNLVLKSGFHVLFAREALVYTEAPLRYKGLCRMFLRWARSNVRETLIMAGFIFTRFRETGALGARINLLLHLFRMTAGELLKTVPLIFLVAHPWLIGSNLILGGLLGGLVPALVYIWRRQSSNFLWAFPYAVFWLAGLSWISMWALFTPHRNGWLTRGGISGPAPAPPSTAALK